MVEQLLRTNDVVLETSQSDKETLVELREAGYFAVLVDRAPVFNKETLLHALYQSCVFPAYFGFNWDALEDTLKSDWLGDTRAFKGYVLVFRNFAVLEERAKNVAETFLGIVRDVVKARREKDNPPLYVVCVKQQPPNPDP
jgi:RNAse (barnase) inhibitor barstar